ncbi:MAG TPA: FkbM family methyltransferase [Candidatus Babeliales bacterium]|jgi:FkbM family methyltransferase|nr:FkbM family methyltransferase [Candidatus Babeliales bacterium]
MIIFSPHKTVDILKPLLPDNPIIVEAGAFDGNDTNKMALQWPQGIIHAFEPVPEIYQRLLNNTNTFSNICYYPLALSDHNGTAQFYISERPTRPGIASQAGSLHKPKERLSKSPLIFPRTAIVPTITLDQWAYENDISSLDLLWLDTQGHELAIMQAAHHIMQNIKVVLAEVSFIESYEGQPRYEEVVAWMVDHGFEYVGRDFADTTTTFFGNALFVKK